jgi:drug/metabolite transporter (DMT)-like permease
LLVAREQRPWHLHPMGQVHAYETLYRSTQAVTAPRRPGHAIARSRGRTERDAIRAWCDGPDSMPRAAPCNKPDAARWSLPNLEPRTPVSARAGTLLLTTTAMIAFAGNSLLCRLALKHTGIDAASFTSIRLVSGALTLWLILRLRGRAHAPAGNWPSALALFGSAAGFSYAYVSLPAGTGALLLFGTVQATMIGYGLWCGDRMGARQWVGLVCAFCGLTALLLPGAAAPSLLGAVLMMATGVSWGVYSLRGRGTGDPIRVTAGNFLRAALVALALSAVTFRWGAVDAPGVWYALASGALASGVGYAIWYTALPGLQATSAATVQLSVPIIAALGGSMVLGEAISVRLLFASAAVLGGIALVIAGRRVKPS